MRNRNEAAILTPLLVLLSFSIVDFASLFYVYLALENGVSQATRFAVTGNTLNDPTTGSPLSHQDSVILAMQQATPTLTIDSSAFSFSRLSGGTWSPGYAASGEVWKVSVKYTWNIMTPLLMFGLMIGSLFVVTRLRNSAAGIPALFVFTFIAGAMLTPILTVAGQFRNGGQLVALAGGMTAVVFFTMATIATVTKKDFSFLGKFLFVGLILLIVASVVNLFFQFPAASLTISAIAELRSPGRLIARW